MRRLTPPANLARLLLISALFACLACKADGAVQARGRKPAPSTPAPGPPAPPAEPVTGAERIGWDQPGASLEEVSGFSYRIIVERSVVERSVERLDDVRCAEGQERGLFACSAALPPIPAGASLLRLVAFAGEVPSSRSVALAIRKVE